MEKKASKVAKRNIQKSLFDFTDCSPKFPADNRVVQERTVTLDNSVYYIPNAPSERATKAFYIKIAKEILEFWESKKIVLLYRNANILQNRIKKLIEEDGITLDQIKTAISNYGKSSWHVENQMWKQPLSFLDKNLILHWQLPKIETKFRTPSSDMDHMHEMIRKISREKRG